MNTPIEKPLESVPIEFAILMPLRGIANGATNMTSTIWSYLRGQIEKETGNINHWIRFGPSYSTTGNISTKFSIRWGSNRFYNKQIGSPKLRNLNMKLRSTKLPGNNWHVNDPEHLHIYK